MAITICTIIYVATMVAALTAIYRYERQCSTSAHTPLSKKWAMLAWHLALSSASAGVAIAVILHIENKKFGVFVLFVILLLTMAGQFVAMILGRGAAQRRS